MPFVNYTVELMWGLVYNGLCSFAYTIKCLSSYIKTLVLSMMLFSSFFVRRLTRLLSPALSSKATSK